MDLSSLEELMKVQKKGDASKEKKQEYLSEMVALLSEEGYSPSSEKYLMEGFSFCSTTPIILYMKGKSSEEKINIFDNVLKGNRFRKNEKGISFKITVSLLCQMINNYPEEKKIIEKLVSNIPITSRNKEGNLGGDSTKVIEKYFASELNKKSTLPDLSSLNIDPIKMIEFCKLFSDLLENIRPNKKLDTEFINRLNNWVAINAKDTSIATSKNNQENVELVITDVKQSEEKMLSDKPLKYNELLEFAEYLKKIESRIAATAIHVSSLEKGMNTVNNKYNEVFRENEYLKREQVALNEQLNKKLAENKKVYEEKEKLIYELHNCRCNYEAKIKDIEMMKSEINKLNSVISIFSSDKQNAKTEQLNSIASRLKPEYLDFKDAIDMEMTLDLGENLRQQISSIFKILSKNGIVVEER